MTRRASASASETTQQKLAEWRREAPLGGRYGRSDLLAGDLCGGDGEKTENYESQQRGDSYSVSPVSVGNGQKANAGDKAGGS